MADTAPRLEPALRGRLVVAACVVERIATIAAREVPAVTAVGSLLDRAVGRGYPSADARVSGDRARVSVEVAVAWPAPLARVTADVRERVRSRLSELAGLRIDAVDVTAAKVLHAGDPERRRVQ